MKSLSKVLIAALFFILLAGGLFADATIHKGDDFTAEIKGDKIVFTLTRAGVTKAAIPGYFNGWKPEAPEAQMQEKDGKWVLEVDLATFTKATPFEFKFHTNGDWDQGGNKALNLAKKQGSWVFSVSPTDAIKPNTKSSSDIEFHGRTSGQIRIAKNELQNSFLPGDGKFYFDQSFLDLDISMAYKIGNKIVGKAILNYNMNQNNDSKNLILDKYTTSIFLDLFTINLFYGERVVEFLNPTRSLDRFNRSYAKTVTFFKESGGEELLFGRNYLGMVFTMDVLSGSLQALITRDKAKDMFNSVMAARYYNNSLVDKKLGIGLSVVYEKFTTTVTRSAQSFMSLLDPNRMYQLYFSKYYECQAALDADFSIGSLALFAEAKTVMYANDNLASPDMFMDMYFTAGIKYVSGAMKLEGRGTMLLRDSSTTSENVTIAQLKAGYVKKNTDLRLQAGAYLFETSEMLLNALLLGKFETDFFDLYANISYIGQDEYMTADARAWIEWYLNQKFRLLGGARLALYKDASNSSKLYLNPYAGIGYKVSQDFNFKLYFGLNPDYSVYREDKGYTIENYLGVRSTSLDGNYLNKEKRMMKNLAIQLEVDASF